MVRACFISYITDVVVGEISLGGQRTMLAEVTRKQVAGTGTITEGVRHGSKDDGQYCREADSGSDAAGSGAAKAEKLVESQSWDFERKDKGN